jgi:hypothetical protein
MYYIRRPSSISTSRSQSDREARSFHRIDIVNIIPTQVGVIGLMYDTYGTILERRHYGAKDFNSWCWYTQKSNVSIHGHRNPSALFVEGRRRRRPSLCSEVLRIALRDREIGDLREQKSNSNYTTCTGAIRTRT